MTINAFRLNYRPSAERVTRTPNHLITEELRYQLRHSGIIELEIGLEPTTCGLLNRYSTIELLQQRRVVTTF